MVRHTFDIPRASHRYFIQPVSENTHLKVKLIKRFLKFYQTLESCDKPHIKYLMKLQRTDHRSVFGSNVSNICAEANAEYISQVLISDISYASVPPEEEWRIPLLMELLEIRSGRLQSPLSRVEIDEINGLIDIVTTWYHIHFIIITMVVEVVIPGIHFDSIFSHYFAWKANLSSLLP